jgi:Mg-chelatase subunit ChlD
MLTERMYFMNNENIAEQNMNAATDAFEPTENSMPAGDPLDFDDDPLSATGVSRKSLVIFFLIDTSGSMKGKKMGELKPLWKSLSLR